jgi:hypothetical protein
VGPEGLEPSHAWLRDARTHPNYRLLINLWNVVFFVAVRVAAPT